MSRCVILILMFASLTAAESKISISVTPGPHYEHSIWGKKFSPQIALWAEDTNGKFIQTIFVTNFSRTDFGKDNVKRPGALPVWRRKGMQSGYKETDAADAMTMATFQVDAKSGATPKSQFTKEWIVPPELKGTCIAVMVEVNNSFDYNDTYRNKLPRTDPYFNGENGQPSIVWKRIITLSETAGHYYLSPIGHGDVQGKRDGIARDFKGISDKFSIIKEIRCIYKEH